MKRYSPHNGNQFSSNIGYKLFRYCGEYLDKETGLIYLRNRYYDSSTGRFITEDPAQDGLNWYSYCAGNPITFKDKYGLWLDGDENLSQGAQTYTKYYGEQWEIANQKYLAATTGVERNKAQAEMDNYHALAEDIRVLDTSGLV